MLSCPVLKPFAVFSSRRSQHRSQSSRAPKKLDRQLSSWLLRSWTGFSIHLLLMKSGNAENGGCLKGRKNFEICPILSARDRRAKSKGAFAVPQIHSWREQSKDDQAIGGILTQHRFSHRP